LIDRFQKTVPEQVLTAAAPNAFKAIIVETAQAAPTNDTACDVLLCMAVAVVVPRCCPDPAADLVRNSALQA
jgi:hypothetical protein